jgi:hypothetical protein
VLIIFMQCINLRDGYIALLSMLIAGAVGSVIAVSVLFFGLDSMRSSFDFQASSSAWAFANACAEEGLQQIRALVSFTGTGSITFSGGASCTYTVSNTGGSTRSISALGTVSSTTRRSFISITKIAPRIVISSWQEVAN